MDLEPVPAAERLVARLARVRDVHAVVMTGSRAQGRAGPDADVDLFVYADADLVADRLEIAADLADLSSAVLVDVDPFGRGDVWRDKTDGIWMDVVYWTPQWAEDELDRVLVRHEAKLGYTTAFWRSIATAVPLYERDAWHSALQERARAPYPDALAESIVATNGPWLDGHPFSFRAQIEKALSRDDLVSVNHRLAAWMACYFDALLAANRVLHPGEKRQVEVVEAECRRWPPHLRRDLDAALHGRDPRPGLERLLVELTEILSSA